jgi:hypothetical protein
MLLCPACSRPALRISASLELGASSASDEVAIQALRCTHCHFTAAASYEESRRGSIESERWSHSAVRITAQDYEKLLASLTACPNPSRSSCTCNAHRWFGQASELGSIQPLRWLPCIEGSGFTPKLAP